MICITNHGAMAFAREAGVNHIFVLVYYDPGINRSIREYWVNEPTIGKVAGNLLDAGRFESLEKVYV